jgi:hypothetical protein
MNERAIWGRGFVVLNVHNWVMWEVFRVFFDFLGHRVVKIIFV